MNTSLLRFFVLIVGSVLLLPTPSLRADVKLPGIFADHMVLQREAPVTVWGWAAPGEEVTVNFGGQQVKATADASGEWKATLAPMSASAESRVLTVSGKNTLTLNDVLVGEIWLCSGQSNMEWALGRSTGGPEALASSTNSSLRFCTIPHNAQLTPQKDVPAKWVIGGDPSGKFFSAIGWWFGNKLQKELGVPVAIINDSYGGTPIQGWMPVEALKKGSWSQDRWNDQALAKAEYDKKKEALQPAMDKYLTDKAAAIQAHQPQPEFPKGWPGDFRGPGTLLNGMVHPLQNFRIRGVAWYQGENNAYVGIANTYRQMLPILISEWRAAFQQPDLPFLIFQLAPNRKPQTDPNEASGIAVVQEAQLLASQKTPHAALIVTEDLGEPDVHYKQKEPAAERAMHQALSLAYGKQGDFSSPTFRSMEIAGNQAVLHFDHASEGLTSKDGQPVGFVIAGEDKNFVFADARIDGEKVIVSSSSITKPVAVRYGWADLPKVNLFNAKGLPMSPFRTDDWPLPEKGGFSETQPTPTPPPVPHP